MDRTTILSLAECELKQLPLAAVEAFVLSQIDGRLTLEEVAEVAGLDFDATARLAKRLLELGAVSASDAKRPNGARKHSRGKTEAPPAMKETGRTRRLDPRAESQTVDPGPPVSPAPAPRAPSKETRTMPKETRNPPEARGGRRRTSHAALRVKRTIEEPIASPPVTPVTQVTQDDVCELDDATCALIVELDGKLGRLDHYAALDVERGAEKKEIKRAYFGLASKFHPDRFFRKKLGRMRAPLDRVFHRLTAAHDILVNRSRREAYDATLPPAPAQHAARHTKVAGPKTERPSRQMKAARKTDRPPRKSSQMLKAGIAAQPPAVIVQAPPVVVVEPAVSVQPAQAAALSDPPPISQNSLRELSALTKPSETQKRVEVFLKAAEQAMKVDDLIGAANCYALALQNTNDPLIRERHDAIQELAKTSRYEKSLARATLAEKNKRWPDAAAHFTKAVDARPQPEASVADRAAFAIRMGEGDLHRAAALAEHAVSMDSKNAGYRVTLGEIYLAANLFKRAAAESARALELAPHDARAKLLAAALPKNKK